MVLTVVPFAVKVAAADRRERRVQVPPRPRFGYTNLYTDRFPTSACRRSEDGISKRIGVLADGGGSGRRALRGDLSVDRVAKDGGGQRLCLRRGLGAVCDDDLRGGTVVEQGKAAPDALRIASPGGARQV